MEVIKNVHMLECTKGSHVYVIKGEESILIDTGIPGFSIKILEELKAIGIEPNSIKHILLTHHDVDHVGNAKALQDATGAQLWASEEDIPFILGKISRTGIKRIVQTLIKYEKPIISNNYSNRQQFGELQVIKASGHTPGHVIFAYENLLFTGDLFKTKGENIKIMPKFMNWNQEELEKSLSILKILEFEWLCPGHGSPIKRSSVWEKFIEKY